jgi:hypothetical protein
MKELIIIIMCLVIPSVIGAFLLISFINWVSFIYDMTPNKAIQLNMRDAIYAFRQGKIKRHPLYWEFYTNNLGPEFEVKVSLPTFIVLNVLHWINKWRGKKKVNKEATNEFLRWLYNEGED